MVGGMEHAFTRHSQNGFRPDPQRNQHRRAQPGFAGCALSAVFCDHCFVFRSQRGVQRAGALLAQGLCVGRLPADFQRPDYLAQLFKHGDLHRVRHRHRPLSHDEHRLSAFAPVFQGAWRCHHPAHHPHVFFRRANPHVYRGAQSGAAGLALRGDPAGQPEHLQCDYRAHLFAGQHSAGNGRGRVYRWREPLPLFRQFCVAALQGDHRGVGAVLRRGVLERLFHRHDLYQHGGMVPAAAAPARTA